jgi:hypothetical protein
MITAAGTFSVLAVLQSAKLGNGCLMTSMAAAAAILSAKSLTATADQCHFKAAECCFQCQLRASWSTFISDVLLYG